MTAIIPADETVASLPELKQYLEGEFGSVGGWCSAHLFQTIQPLHNVQKSLGVDAPVGEIGVYHGKFLIGLIKTKGCSGNYAIDVFDLQQFNLDGAGKGNLQIFKANLERAGVPARSVEIFRADSMAIGRAEIANILDKSGGFSMFSVDGCHMVEHTINDIQLAMELTIPEGVIFVDDYYNSAWPGVQEGVAKLFFHSAPKFVPLLYTSNKLVLCHISFHQTYLSYVSQFLKVNQPAIVIKRVRRFGYDTLTVSPDLKSTRYVV